MDQPLFFPDISHYQHGLDLTGAAAVLAKATQGTSYVDPTYAGFKAQAAALGIPFGAYHWLDTTDAAAQARHAFSVVGPTVPLMIDDEQNRVDVAHTLAFVAAYRKLGGRVVLEYVPRWLWSSSGKPSLARLAAAGLSIVASAYPIAGYTPAGVGWDSYGDVTPTVWQYTDKHMLNGRPCDFNAFRGSLADLRTLLYGTPQLKEDDGMKVFRALPSGAVWVSNGAQRWHVPDPDTYHRTLKLWGLTVDDVIPMVDGDEAGLGQDVTAAAGGIQPGDTFVITGTFATAHPAR